MTCLIELGYVGFAVSDLAAWRRFAGDVLGLGVLPGPTSDICWLKMDARPCRIILTQGAADDIAFMGWRVADSPALTEFAAHLDANGVGMAWGDEADRNLRGVDGLLYFVDPDGNRHEAYVERPQADAPFISSHVPSGFVTGAGGLGHLVFGTRNYPAMLAFTRDVLGMKLSDIIRQEISGGMIDVSFFHLNERHHSFALSDRGGAKRLHHFMLEVGRIEDVGYAQDRHRASEWQIAQSIGQHPNDRMISYYGVTPSGFLIEFGWGGVKIDETSWSVMTYPNLSDWGHHRVMSL